MGAGLKGVGEQGHTREGARRGRPDWGRKRGLAYLGGGHGLIRDILVIGLGLGALPAAAKAHPVPRPCARPVCPT